MRLDKPLKYTDVMVSTQSGVYGSAQHNPWYKRITIPHKCWRKIG
jgi:hypothetical protein